MVPYKAATCLRPSLFRSLSSPSFLSPLKATSFYHSFVSANRKVRHILSIMRFTLITLVAAAIAGTTAWAAPVAVTKTSTSSSPYHFGARHFHLRAIEEAVVPTVAAVSPFQLMDREEKSIFEISHFEVEAEPHFALI